MTRLALKEWAEVFRRLPKIDGIFVPGGDPGSTEPKSFKPRSRLSIDSQRSPSGAKIATTIPRSSPSPIEFQGVMPTAPISANTLSSSISFTVAATERAGS